MTYEEFMKLENGDGVVFDGFVGTVTLTKSIWRNEKMIIDGMVCTEYVSRRELEISIFDFGLGCIRKVYPFIYVDYPNEAHNLSILSRMSVWDPFASL